MGTSRRVLALRNGFSEAGIVYVKTVEGTATKDTADSGERPRATLWCHCYLPTHAVESAVQ